MHTPPEVVDIHIHFRIDIDDVDNHINTCTCCIEVTFRPPASFFSRLLLWESLSACDHFATTVPHVFQFSTSHSICPCLRFPTSAVLRSCGVRLAACGSWTKLEALHSDVLGRSHILGGESGQMVAAMAEPSALKERVGSMLAAEYERSGGGAGARDAFAAAALALVGALTAATGALSSSQKEVQRWEREES